jgi:hypothetical protein
VPDCELPNAELFRATAAKLSGDMPGSSGNMPALPAKALVNTDAPAKLGLPHPAFACPWPIYFLPSKSSLR